MYINKIPHFIPDSKAIQNPVPRGVRVRFPPPAPSFLAGSDKPTARWQASASADCMGSNGPHSAVRNDNHRVLSCWPLATPSGVRPTPQTNAAKHLLLARSARLALLRPHLILGRVVGLSGKTAWKRHAAQAAVPSSCEKSACCRLAYWLTALSAQLAQCVTLSLPHDSRFALGFCPLCAEAVASAISH